MISHLDFLLVCGDLRRDRQVILQVVNRTRNHNMRKVMSTLISLGNVIDRVRGLTELAKGNRGRGSAEFLRNSSEFVRNHAKIVSFRIKPWF